MSNQRDNSGKFDDADLHSVFDSNDVKVPEELDQLILKAAKQEVSYGKQQQEDSNESGRAGGYSNHWAKALGVAAVLVIAVAIVPLLSTTKNTEIVADAGDSSNEVATSVAAVADEQLDSDAAELHLEESEADNELVELAERAPQPIPEIAATARVAEPTMDAVGGSAGVISTDESEEASTSELLAQNAKLEQLVNSNAEVGARYSAPAVDLRGSAESETQIGFREDSDASVDQDLSSIAAADSAAAPDGLARRASAEPSPEETFPAKAAPDESAQVLPKVDADAIIKAHSYRRSESSWLKKILELHGSEDTDEVLTELRFFRLVHPNSQALKQLRELEQYDETRK